jgi:hypothetical protein
MWPKHGDEIEVYRNGVLIAEGFVNYMDDSVISVTGKQLSMYRLKCSDLSSGLEECTG